MRGRNVDALLQRSLQSVVAFGLLCGAPATAHADANGVKGTIGGAMIGAEAVMLTESAFRLRPTWMYLAGGAGGGLLGGYLGYKISDGSSNKPPSFLLAGGIALIIPTIMGVLTATQYEPIGSVRQELPDSDSEQSDPEQSDSEESGSDGDGSGDEDAPGDIDSNDPEARNGVGRERARTTLRPREMHLELPSVGLAQAFSRDELALYGVRQVTELHLALLRGVF